MLQEAKRMSYVEFSRDILVYSSFHFLMKLAVSTRRQPL
jgi:hypothetical protein